MIEPKWNWILHYNTKLTGTSTTTLQHYRLQGVALLQDTSHYYRIPNDKVLLRPYSTTTMIYMTGIKTTPVNQSSEYKMENLSHWIKLDIY